MTEPFFRRLMEWIDPQRSPDPLEQEAHVLCGRWLALRRMRLGAALGDLAGKCGVSEEQLLYLETGVASAEDIGEAAQGQLVEALAPDPRAADYVRAVLELALGLRPVDPRLMTAVQADLDG